METAQYAIRTEDQTVHFFKTRKDAMEFYHTYIYSVDEFWERVRGEQLQWVMYDGDDAERDIVARCNKL